MLRLLFIFWIFLPQIVYSQQTSSISSKSFYISNIDNGSGNIGLNDFSFSVVNQSDSSRVFFISLRTEGGWNWQKGYYFNLPAQVEQKISSVYYVPDHSNLLLKAFFGTANTMPTDVNPYPDTDIFEMRQYLNNGASEVWQNDSSGFHYRTDIPVTKPRQNERHVSKELLRTRNQKREHLKEIIQWNREAVRSFDPVTTDRYRLGEFELRTMQIQGEPGVPVTFLIMQPAGITRSMPTILFLNGNPSGAKMEAGITKMIPFVSAGFQVVSIDRRQSAVETDPGEFLDNIADPVFDAKRLVDYLITRQDVRGDKIGIVGFSAGAYESQFLLALHEAVDAGVLVSRPIDHNVLFESNAWWPTLYNPDILPEIGLDSLVDASFSKQYNALTTHHGLIAIDAYHDLYPFFDNLNPPRILSLAVPKPQLVITGALDTQFPVRGVLALDKAVQDTYKEWNVPEFSQLFIMPRVGHEMAPQAIDLTIDFLSTFQNENNN